MLDDWQWATSMTHLFTPNKNPFYKEPAFAFAVTAIFVLWALFTLAGCSEKDPPKTPEEMIQGAWIRHWTPANATNNYSFDGRGQFIEYSIIQGQHVQGYAYAYSF